MYNKITGEIVDDIWCFIKNSKLDDSDVSGYKKKYKKELKFKLFVYIVRNKKRKLEFQIDGSADKATIEIMILLCAPSLKAERFLYNKLNAKLNDTVRHEIEHLLQDGENRRRGKEKPVSIKERKKCNKSYKYFLLRDEIPAMVRGMHRQAKIERLPLDEVFSDYLYSFLYSGFITSEQKKIIMDEWIKYAKKFLPKAVFSKIS